MPLYEYECDERGHRFEKIQKFSDPLIDKCPICGSPVHKLISSPAIQFKGSGWYITDYAKKDAAATKADKTEAGTGSSAESKSDTTTDSKSDTKTDAKADTKTEKKTGAASGGKESSSKKSSSTRSKTS
jgi:putative FmdB family regulatory protein